MKRFSAANCITVTRMIGTVVLLTIPVLSRPFLVVYTLTGVTDVLDGWVARRTGTASRFGAMLDSWADLLFYFVVIGRLFPLLQEVLPRQIWWAVLGIVGVRMCAFAVAAGKYRVFASVHTGLNKLTGAAVFLIPYTMASSLAAAYCWGVCTVAGLASAEELVLHLIQSEYDPDRRGLLRGRKNV